MTAQSILDITLITSGLAFFAMFVYMIWQYFRGNKNDIN